MALIKEIRGVKQVLEKLRRKYAEHERAAERGLRKVGLLIQRTAMPLTPIDTGNLRRSFAVRKVQGQGFKAVFTVVNTASYAIYVHENLEAAHRPPTRAKFLEVAIRSLVAKGEPSKVMRAEFTRGFLK